MFDRKIIFRKLPWYILVFFGIFLIPCRAMADTGPKASIAVTVEHPPEGHYYIDLLEQYDFTDGEDAEVFLADRKEEILREEEEFLEEHTSDGDRRIQDILYSYQEGGWYARLSGGIVDSTFHENNKEHQYSFSYSVPDTFKVILVTAEGDVYVSPEITKKQYNGVFTYDRNTGKIREEFGASVLWGVAQGVLCFLITLVWEGGLLALFGLFHKKNLKLFLLMNTITQLLLNACIQWFQFSCGGGWIMHLVILPLEFVIAGVEAWVYCRRFTDREGVVHKIRNIVYGIVANLCSFLFGVQALSVILEMISALS